MIVTIDFETYFSQEYSLRRMSEVDYILDPRFQVIMLSIKQGDEPTQVYTGGFEVALKGIRWDEVACLAHNIRFDGSILFWHFGIQPRMWLDTLSMARGMTHALVGKSSLAEVARYMNLPPKGDEVMRAQGKRREDFSPEELARYAEYCAHDTDLAYTIFKRFVGAGFPVSEMAVIDLASRCFIEPQAKLNKLVLSEHLNAVRTQKEIAFAKFAHLPKDVFSSNLKFATLLESLGVTVPTKISPNTGQEIPALAKNDRAFKELCADPDQPAEVQAACACRINAKSTIEETRTATMLNLSLREWGEGVGPGWMPVPYRYWGARTGRFSGDGGFNFANLKRGSRIREAIEAPLGYRVVHRDSSQIECRMLALMAGCHPLLEAFRQGRDVYSEFASAFFRKAVTKAQEKERYVGKTCVLGLGYGLGGPRLRHTLYIGTGEGDRHVSVHLADDNQAWSLVNFYRQLYPQIPLLWKIADNWLERMILAKRPDHPNYPLIMSMEMPEIPFVSINTDAVRLPNGMAIQYPDLRQETDPAGMYVIVYDTPNGGGSYKLYGAKMIENITQALARIVVTDIALKVWDEYGFRPFMSTYDSHDYIVPEDKAEWFDGVLSKVFREPPGWAVYDGVKLPLASEGGWGRTLLEAEQGVNR